MAPREDWRDRDPEALKPLLPDLWSPRSSRSRPLSLASLRLALAAFLRTRLGQAIVTVAACLGWMTASSWAILVNKHIMVGLHFPYPCTIAWMGLATTTLASWLALRLAPTSRPLGSPARSLPLGGSGGALAEPLGAGGFPTGSPVQGGGEVLVLSGARFKMTPRYYLTRVLPTGFFMALTFQTGNMGYLYLTVAFVQMLKAFCPVVTMLLLFVARLEAPSTRLVAAVTLIACGVALASYGELNLSLFGLAAMLVSVVAESVRLVLTQHLLAAPGLPGAALQPVEGLFYISSACTAVLAVQASYTEMPALLARRDWQAVGLHPGQFAVAACCGFAVNMLAITVIKLASSLTLKVLGTVKDAALVTIGIVFLHERVTLLQLVGYTISMMGFVSYNLIKARQGTLGGTGKGGGGVLAGNVDVRGPGLKDLLLPVYAVERLRLSSGGGSKMR
ncbi:hypothetical protein HYH03_012313 [Edaphochlamys debaryana]|uniref:Sugar phosphate transporter domain-containing protein n=1 Tax=Edaphochlamys debaryana TaxID=47281 RepID=A0A836BUH9_9CHLO|nr:hypothetical protein HYH03_012313 [Edaphochlamys debaryana]|eukprot:KAG2489087.1 hypothetical protein HYH03_012313 [Edaphochlamys debaryana]